MHSPEIIWTPEIALEKAGQDGINFVPMCLRMSQFAHPEIYKDTVRKKLPRAYSKAYNGALHLGEFLSSMQHQDQGIILGLMEATVRVPGYSCLEGFDDAAKMVEERKPGLKQRVIPVLVVDKNLSHTLDRADEKKIHRDGPAKLAAIARSRRIITLETTQNDLRQDLEKALDTILKGENPDFHLPLPLRTA